MSARGTSKHLDVPDHVLDPKRLVDQELTFKFVTNGRRSYHLAQIDGLTAGRISREKLKSTRHVWSWTLNYPYVPEHLRPFEGQSDNLEGAKQAFSAAFARWRDWAVAQPGTVLWMGVDSGNQLINKSRSGSD